MKRILVLFGSNSFEHDISIKSVNFIINNFHNKKYKLVGIDFDGTWYEVNKITLDENWKNNIIERIDNIIDYSKRFDLVLPIIHGSTGEDGKIQAMFELFNIKYVGCNSYSSLICYDKMITKLILEKYSIPQIPYQIYNKNIDYNTIKYPVIVKPAKCGSSIGISIANSKNELINSIKLANKYDKNIIIEKFIKNKREFECAIIENKDKLIISKVGEIITNSWYNYDLKYNNNDDNFNIILGDEEQISKDIKTYSKKIFKLLNCKKLARIDFIYDNSNKKLYFNEINTMPGLTESSMFPKLLNNIGINNEEIVDLLAKL